MARVVFLFAYLCISLSGLGQKYQTEKSSITFFSSAPIEDIEAVNESAASRYDFATNEIAISIPINKFKFEKALMEEHFNEKYLESDKYPKAVFVGHLEPTLGKGQATRAKATGKLTIHGVTKEVVIQGDITWVGEMLIMKSSFVIKLEDYKIKIPKLMWQNIAEEVEVKAEFTFKRL